MGEFQGSSKMRSFLLTWQRLPSFEGMQKTAPNLFKTLSFDNVYIVGGGMTSASSLLSHGETFIRNQLLGTAWVKKHIPTYVPNSAGKARKTINYSWLPDDFALDPNLPAILEAMDLRGVGFSRVAGYPDTVNSGFEYGAHYHGHKYEDAHGSPWRRVTGAS